MAQVDELNDQLEAERHLGRKRHSSIIDDLTRALQARDAALNAIKKLDIRSSDNIFEVRFNLGCFRNC